VADAGAGAKEHQGCSRRGKGPRGSARVSGAGALEGAGSGSAAASQLSGLRRRRRSGMP